MTDHYATLGVARTASADEIKRAFRRLASQHHPDKGGDTKKFQEIQAAYDTLGDAAKRQAYDHPAPQFQNFPGGFSTQFNMNDIFGQMFGQAFGQQRPQQNFVRMSLWIRLADVALGGRRPISVGTPQGTNTIEIEIPPGINDGDNVQYQGLAPGGHDLVVQFRIHPDPVWQRNDLTLTTEKSVSIWDLILGADIALKNLQGHELVAQIPPRTQPKTLLRLKGQGLRNRSGQVGDVLLRVNAVIPDHINSELLDAIEKYRK
jgi:DnaJ-class molecular chaperone